MKGKVHQKINGLHERNKHNGEYDFELLIKLLPELSEYVFKNKWNKLSIDFFNPEAVKLLNKALLKQYYNIETWDIPESYLTPPIPGRANYIHHIADLLRDTNSKTNVKPPSGEHINMLDIGMGANCIYPIIGRMEYGWSFVGSETDIIAIENAQKIISSHKKLQSRIEIRQQENNNSIFKGIIKTDELFDVSICNPPFHATYMEAEKANKRKTLNLKSDVKPHKNFGGQSNELWYKGGEKQFITNMINESSIFSNNCLWFTTLVSKESNLDFFKKVLKSMEADHFDIIEMNHANKKTRILYWSFLKENQREKWMKIKTKL